MAEVTLEMLGVLVQRSLDEQGAIRRESTEMRRLVLAVVEQGRRIERRFDEQEHRISEFRDDLELTIKAELMGRLGHFETQIDARLSGIESRLVAP